MDSELVPLSPDRTAMPYYRDLALSELVALRHRRLDAAIEASVHYHSCFRRWEDHASVRVRPRSALQVSAAEVYFPPELIPVLTHARVRALGPEAAHELMIQRLYNYLHFTVELEQLAVIPIAMKISRGRAGLWLPPAMRSDAFKIVTDEAWHGQFSYDLICDVEATTASPYDAPATPAFIERLDAIRIRLPAEARGLEALLFAVVSETLISRILVDLPRDQRLPSAVRSVIKDHALDEARHHAYFRSLLQHLWPTLDTSLSRQVGQWIPEIIFAFLEPDYEATAVSLHRVGLSGEAIAEVLAESLPRNKVVREVAQAAGPAVRYFQEVGALRDSATRDAFLLAGLVTADRA